MLRLGLLASILSLCCGDTQLEVVTLTESHADLTYTDLSTGSGLHVVSTPDSLFVATLDGQSLVAVEEAANSMRLIGLGQAQFIQVKTGAGLSRDFAVPNTECSKLLIYQNIIELLCVFCLELVSSKRHTESPVSNTRSVLNVLEVNPFSH